jgi:CspA family cold shock protein
MTGRVKWFSETKGYGFIACDDSSPDVFVHHSGIKAEGFKTLMAGQTVEFEVEQTDRGRQASNLVVVEKDKED